MEILVRILLINFRIWKLILNQCALNSTIEKVKPNNNCVVSQILEFSIEQYPDNLRKLIFLIHFFLPLAILIFNR